MLIAPSLKKQTSHGHSQQGCRLNLQIIHESAWTEICHKAHEGRGSSCCTCHELRGLGVWGEQEDVGQHLWWEETLLKVDSLLKNPMQALQHWAEGSEKRH